MYEILKNLFFLLDPEVAHDLTLNQFSKNPKYLRKMFPAFTEHQEVLSEGLVWRNKLGLAAGFDKNGVALEFLDYLGFGAIELGTVTLKPQEGNEKPRIFRHQEELSLRNYLGFPCKGADFVKKKTKAYRGDASLGINIGKNKDTPLNKAADDYRELVKIFEEDADYLVINVSSPNTKDLRKLQDVEFMKEILSEVNDVREFEKPLYVKVSPDEDLKDFEAFVELLVLKNVQGIIATNTTVKKEWGRGGVSGEELKLKARKTQLKLLELTEKVKNFEIICAGGISGPEDIRLLEEKGASFFQIYTSFIYQGPSILKKLLTF